MSVKPRFIDRSKRARLEILGPDRAKFLHNLTTNDVKRLAPGKGQESFVTSPQGKTLGYMTVLATDDRLILRTDPGGFSLALPHFQKYGVFDDIELVETSDTTFEYHVDGLEIEAWLLSEGATIPEPGELSHSSTNLGAIPVHLIRESLLGPHGWTILGAIGDAPSFQEALHSRLGATDLDPNEAECSRIERGLPVYGLDISANNLPQEVGRDSQAINFVKGCYLGQETVARIDALGHVNKLLCGLVVSGEAHSPKAGDLIEADGKKVGTVTSVATTEHQGVFVALGYLKTTLAQSGTEVRVILEEDGATSLPAIVVDLPMEKRGAL